MSDEVLLPNTGGDRSTNVSADKHSLATNLFECSGRTYQTTQRFVYRLRELSNVTTDCFSCDPEQAEELSQRLDRNLESVIEVLNDLPPIVEEDQKAYVASHSNEGMTAMVLDPLEKTLLSVHMAVWGAASNGSDNASGLYCWARVELEGMEIMGT
ncbi:hypothetical protein M231_02051 [Tremella mesenterica]|uniref:Uncharacterized protein n=1 Tax=Tremella mesenterica TaxID=5217 RepID=A0A4Q1BRK4_TREME|nr:hypothetical protein M231_02051 [Tremella mesenterica]